MDKGYTPIEKLDLVLSFLANDVIAKPKISQADLFSALASKYPSLKNQNDFGSELHRILEKLQKDDYVLGVPREYQAGLYDNLPMEYKITFDGFLFISELGGYAQKKLNDTSESKRLTALETSRDSQARALNRLTWWIAAGTIALATEEIIKMGIDYHWFSCGH